MSEQANKANKFAREKIGADVDAMAGPAGLRVVKDGDGEDGKASAPWIELPGSGRLLSQWAGDVGNLLAECGVFRLQKIPVTVDMETGQIDVITPDRFRTLVEDHAVTYKSNFVRTKSGQEIEEKNPATMTRECASGTLNSDRFIFRLKKIRRVNRCPMPVRREDGREELLKDGYDEQSQIFTLPSGIAINEKLTTAEAATMLRDYLADFPFADERSRSVAVAEMVALFVFDFQELTANRMGFMYIANKVRSGKSLLAQFGITACHGLAKGQTLGDKEELRKLLDASALQGAPYLFFDNLTGHVKSNYLESFMTTPVWTGRVMGRNDKTFEAEKGTIVILTGNNLTTSPDIQERCLICSLHQEEADPHARKLKRIFTAQKLATKQVRGDLLSALWAIVRGWIAAGRPKGKQRRAGFEEWSELIGGIVTSAGFADPLEKPKDEELTSREDLDAQELVEQLAGAIPADKKMHEFQFQDLVDVCVEHECFSWKFVDGKRHKADEEEGEKEWFECGQKTSSALGRVFGTDMAGQIYTLKNGARVRFGKRGQNRHRRYQVEILSEPSGPPAK